MRQVFIKFIKVKKSLLTFFLITISLFSVIFLSASLSAAAEKRMGAIQAANTRVQNNAQSAANLGAGGPGSDLRAIASPKKPQTLTGFPAGTLPDASVSEGSGSQTSGPLEKTVMSGEPLPPPIGSEMIGSKIDKLFSIAEHLSYNLVKKSYSPTVMDAPYTYYLMDGKRKIVTLYFDRSMMLTMVE